MKAVILAGGLPSTLTKEHERIPKPMVEIGGKPILWHIMKSLSEQGVADFIICGGYKIELIKSYFMDFYIYQSDITVDLSSNKIEVHQKRTEDWKVTIVDTGVSTPLINRIEMVKGYIDDTFYVTYGDCLSNISIHDMLEWHKLSRKSATISLVKPTGRKKLIQISEDGKMYDTFSDNTVDNTAWVNGDSFIFSQDIFTKIPYLPTEIDGFVNELKRNNDIQAYCHMGYWSSIETMHDLVVAENLWNQGKAPWVKA